MGINRWIICALLFFATTINYMDRQVIALLAPELQKMFAWNEIQYGDIVQAFYIAYALGSCWLGVLLNGLAQGSDTP